MTEVWKPLPYAPAYEVSTEGRVRSTLPWRGRPGPRLLRPWPNSDGYPSVHISAPTKGEMTIGVHRLVAHTFLGHQMDGVEVRHLDGDVTNNRLSNLAYGTHSMNMLDSVAHRTHNMARKTHCKHGHEYTPENTIIRTSEGGGRRCRTCRQASSRRYEQKRAAS